MDNIPSITIEDDYYIFYSNGYVYSKKKKKPLNYTLKNNRKYFYLSGNYKINDCMICRSVSSIIYKKFIGQIPNKNYIVIHKDNNTMNNSVDNLELQYKKPKLECIKEKKVKVYKEPVKKEVVEKPIKKEPVKKEAVEKEPIKKEVVYKEVVEKPVKKEEKPIKKERLPAFTVKKGRYIFTNKTFI